MFLSGCAHWTYSPNATLLGEYDAVQAAEQKLFADLQAPAPTCTAAGTAPDFNALQSSLAAAEAEAAKPGNKPAAHAGIVDLRKASTDLQSSVTGGSDCLPQDAVRVQKKLFEDGLANLMAAEHSRS
jgi:hypothetical protein